MTKYLAAQLDLTSRQSYEYFHAQLPPTSVTLEIRPPEQLDEAKAMLARSCRREYSAQRKARLHGSIWLINAIESMTLNWTDERHCLHGSTKLNEAVD
jgi:hypothetical protein